MYSGQALPYGVQSASNFYGGQPQPNYYAASRALKGAGGTYTLNPYFAAQSPAATYYGIEVHSASLGLVLQCLLYNLMGL